MICRKDKWAFRRIDERCNSLWQGLPSLRSCDESESSLVDETSREGIYDNWVPFEGSIFKQLGIQRKPLLAFALFQVPTAQNNMPKWHILKWHFMNFYSHILGVAYPALFTNLQLRVNRKNWSWEYRYSNRTIMLSTHLSQCVPLLAFNFKKIVAYFIRNPLFYTELQSLCLILYKSTQFMVFERLHFSLNVFPPWIQFYLMGSGS